MQKKTTVIRAVLLQVPAVDVDGNRISFHLKKAEAVFYYLMVEKKASRQELAALLWPDEDMVQASRHLRDGCGRNFRVFIRNVSVPVPAKPCPGTNGRKR